VTCNLPLTISSLVLLVLFHLVTALLVRPKKRTSPLFVECREMFERAGYAYAPMVFVLAPEFGVFALWDAGKRVLAVVFLVVMLAVYGFVAVAPGVC